MPILIINYEKTIFYIDSILLYFIESLGRYNLFNTYFDIFKSIVLKIINFLYQRLGIKQIVSSQ